MLKTYFNKEKLIIITSENGGNVEYNYGFFKEDFEKWSYELNVFIASTEHLKRYLLESGYKVLEIKEVI